MKPLTSNEIAKHLLSDRVSYEEFVERMLTKYLNKNDTDRIYWDAWFRNAKGKESEVVPLSEIPLKKSLGLLSFHIFGLRFETAEESIAILKNKKGFDFDEAREFFDIFFEEWDKIYKDMIPHWTEEHLKGLLESIPAMTEEEAKEKYKEHSEKYLLVKSFITGEKFDGWN